MSQSVEYEDLSTIGAVGGSEIRNAQEQHEADLESTSVASYASSAERTRRQKAKLAALEQEQRFIAQEAELERLRLANEQANRQLRMEKELAVVRAELQVYMDPEDPEISFKCPAGTSSVKLTGSVATDHGMVNPSPVLYSRSAVSDSVVPSTRRMVSTSECLRTPSFAVSNSSSAAMHSANLNANNFSSATSAYLETDQRRFPMAHTVIAENQTVGSINVPIWSTTPADVSAVSTRLSVLPISSVANPYDVSQIHAGSSTLWTGAAVGPNRYVVPATNSIHLNTNGGTYMVNQSIANMPQTSRVAPLIGVDGIYGPLPMSQSNSAMYSSVLPTVYPHPPDSCLPNALENVLRQNQMPKLEMKVFHGDPLDFQQWLIAFEKLIEEATDDPARRLHYLNQYTSGEANVLVSGHILGQSEQDYQSAKSELKKEFGNPYVLARSFIEKIEKWPIIKVSDGDALNSLAIFLKKCKGSMPSLRHLQQLNTDLYLQKIVTKLPYAIQGSWRKVVSQYEERNEDVNFDKLVTFVAQQAQMAKHPVFSAEALANLEGRAKIDKMLPSRPKDKVKVKSASMATNVTELKAAAQSSQNSSPSTAEIYCALCNKRNHDLDDCRVYLRKSLPDRREFLATKKLCFACYEPTTSQHSARNCKRRRLCKTCNRQHPTSLHGFRPTSVQTKDDKIPAESCGSSQHITEVKTTSCATAAVNGSVTMSIVMVRLRHNSNPNNVHVVYAALDSLSTACFIDKTIWKKLGSPGARTDITVKTITDERRFESFAVDGLTITSVNSNDIIQLPKVYTQDQLPIDPGEIPSHSVLRRWPHLKHLISDMPDRDVNVPIGLLIGANCVKALEPRQVLPSVDGGPYAVKTALGWCISGPTESNSNEVESSCRVVCHRIQAVEDTSIKDMMVGMYDNDFNELMVSSSYTYNASSAENCRHEAMLKNNSAMSQEDCRFMTLMQSESKWVNGHYECPLPLRRLDMRLPNNRAQAVQRAIGIKRRFARDSKYAEDYRCFMKEILDKGYARKAPEETEESDKAGIRWYLPHHGIYHPQKPNKIRVVFDCSCQYAGVSLNKRLLQGPNLMNSLVGVLMRFRQDYVAFVADIESMFYQVRIPESQADYLSFVWWPNGNTEEELVDYQMLVHLFGGISSPSCASYALRRTADDNENKFGREAAQVLRNNFYVDDLLKSSESSEAAIRLIAAVRGMCEAGGFHLTKFMSNDRGVLEQIPVNDRAKGIKNLNFSEETLPVERVLGVQWCIENDTLRFRITLHDKPLTRRGILSVISSIYDPLGLAAPFLLNGRRLLQRLCANSKGWDEPIPDEERVAWENWKLSLPLLERIEIRRCVKPAGFGKIVSASLHHFSDASYEGYGQCSYLRLVNNVGKINCALVMGKSRVPPMKPITIPRLELTAATVSVKVGSMLRSELEYQQLTEVYWTDSQVVLGYVRNEARRFHIYVANRIQLIREHSDIQSWRYVSSKNNPADDASRGLDCAKITVKHRWFNGPDFLWTPEDEWPTNLQSETVSEDDPEVRKPKVVHVTKVEQTDDLVTKLENYTSDWYKLKKLVAVWLMFISFLRNKQSRQYANISVEMMQRAEVEIIKSVQNRAFRSEITEMKSKSDVSDVSRRACKGGIKMSSQIYRLDPFIDQHGVLRVGGRLRNSELEKQLKHPIILPKSAHVTNLIARWCHERVQHAGRGLTLNEIRSRGYWIVQGNSKVRSLIYKCVKCRALRGKLGEQMMSDLPPDRVTPSPPFTYCAVDLFGPFVIREGRKELKRYGCLFTCLACRAVHIETTNSLDTDSFINALRRFIARRGEIRELRSDQGTNFVGAEAELKRALSEMNHDEIKRYLRQKGADYRYFTWKKNPPFASHMGGVWERQIRSVRAILSSILKTHGNTLDDELFRTLLTEVESVVNSRPLTTETLSDDTGPIPLSPNNLLTMKSKVIVPPPGCFQRTDLYCRRRWRRVQHLANEFWSRWKKEYLASLQSRPKDCIKKRNFKVGDIVLLKELELHRNDWPLAKITDVHWDDKHECVRSVKLLMASRDFTRDRTIRERPIDKIVLLCEAE